jgi:hypothetical protein
MVTMRLYSSWQLLYRRAGSERRRQLVEFIEQRRKIESWQSWIIAINREATVKIEWKQRRKLPGA